MDRGTAVWLTGNSEAGKTTLADAWREKHPSWINLDGDEMRATISLGAGFSPEDRREHNLRVARLARLLSTKGHDVIVSVIAPFQEVREEIQKIIPWCQWVYLKRDSIPVDPDRPYEEPPREFLLVELDIDSLKVKEEVNALGSMLQ